MTTQTTTHTMRIGGQDKPWRPADFPTCPPITSATPGDEQWRTRGGREPAVISEPVQEAYTRAPSPQNGGLAALMDVPEQVHTERATPEHPLDRLRSSTACTVRTYRTSGDSRCACRVTMLR